MTNVKRWLIKPQSLTPNDYAWVISLGCNISYQRKSEPVTTAGGKMYSMATGTDIYILTTTPEQETMLRLKYTDMVLITTAWIHAGQCYQDDFGSIYV